MKKLIVIAGSVTTYSLYLSRLLRPLSKDLDVIVYMDILPDEDISYSRIEYRTLPFVRRPSFIKDFVVLINLCWQISQERHSLVLSLTPKAGLLSAMSATLLRLLSAGPAFVHIFQGEVWSNKTGIKRRLLKSADIFIALAIKDIIVVSRSELTFLRGEKVLGLNQGECLGHGSICGVDEARFCDKQKKGASTRIELGISESKVVFGYVGRVCEDKGIRDLLKAYQTISKLFTDVVLLIVGPVENSDLYKEMIRPGVIHVPQVSDPAKYFSVIDTFIMPSYREGFGLAVIEAGAMGIPVIATDIYGLRDASNFPEGCLFFEPGDVERLVSHMIFSLEQKERCIEQASRHKEYVLNNYRESKVVEQYKKYILQRADSRYQ